MFGNAHFNSQLKHFEKSFFFFNFYLILHDRALNALQSTYFSMFSQSPIAWTVSFWKLLKAENNQGTEICQSIDPVCNNDSPTDLFFIVIFQELRVVKNFSSLKAIISGLQSHAVYRLQRVWEHVSK